DRNGEWVDLSIVPGPGSATVDSAFLGGLTAGCLAVENPRLALRLEFSFDPEVFPWVNLWMPYGGLHDGPLAGMYGLGPEPWRTPLPLGQAIEAGEAIRLAPGARLKTELAV